MSEPRYSECVPGCRADAGSGLHEIGCRVDPRERPAVPVPTTEPASGAYDDLFALQSKVRSFVYSQMGRVSEEEVRPVIDALDRIAAFAERRDA